MLLCPSHMEKRTTYVRIPKIPSEFLNVVVVLEFIIEERTHTILTDIAETSEEEWLWVYLEILLQIRPETQKIPRTTSVSRTGK